MENSSVGRMMSVLTAPAKTFRSIAERPTAWVAILILVIISTGISVVVTSKVDGEAMVRAQLEKSGQEMSDEQAEQAVAFGSKMKWLGPAAVLVLAPIVMLVFSAIILVAFKVQGSEIDFKRSLSVYTYSSMPAVVKGLLTVPVALSRDEVSAEAAQAGTLLMSNLAFLAPDDAGPAVVAALGSADVFSVWMIVLLSMGYSIVGKVSKPTATATVVALWILAVAVKVGLAALGGMAGG